MCERAYHKGEEQLTVLMMCAPSPEEVGTVKEYKGPENVLGKPEQFMRIVAEIPAVERRYVALSIDVCVGEPIIWTSLYW